MSERQKTKTTLGNFEQHVIVFGASLYRSAMSADIVRRVGYIREEYWIRKRG